MDDLGNPPPGGGTSISHQNTQDIPQNLEDKMNSLENENHQLLKRLCDLELLCIELKNEVTALRTENEKLKNPSTFKKPLKTFQKTAESSKISSQTEYLTDEEELARETDWILKKNRPNKKRKADSSPEITQGTSTQSKNSTIVNPTAQEVKPRPPPPIMISGVSNYGQFYQTIRQKAINEFTIKLMSNGTYKINTSDSTDFRVITELLSKEDTSWYTYEDKQSRPIRVIVKNLHYSCEPTMIVDDLKAQGLKALSAINKLMWKTKEPLNMFLLSFDAAEDINKIYKIDKIMNSIVNIEKIKNPNIIPQCKKCQAFGHTKNYCAKPPRCVKCAGQHSTIDCKKPDNQHPKCCNCGEAHPANYRGCIVAKELQKIRNKSSSGQTKANTAHPTPPTLTSAHPSLPTLRVDNQSARNLNLPKTAPVTQKLSYAQVTSNGNNPKRVNHAVNNDILLEILAKLNSQEDFNKNLQNRLDKLEKNTHKALTKSNYV